MLRRFQFLEQLQKLLASKSNNYDHHLHLLLSTGRTLIAPSMKVWKDFILSLKQLKLKEYLLEGKRRERGE